MGALGAGGGVLDGEMYLHVTFIPPTWPRATFVCQDSCDVVLVSPGLVL